MPKVLIIRYGKLGDVVLTTSVVQALYENGYEVHILTRKPYHILFEDDYRVSKVLLDGKVSLRELREEGYDYVLDLHAKLKSFLVSKLLNFRHSFTYNKRFFRRRLMLLTKKLHTLPNVYEMYNEVLKGVLGFIPRSKPKLIVEGKPPLDGEYIIINPTARYRKRIWNWFRELDDELEALGIRRVYIGLEQDLHMYSVSDFGGINLVGKTDLKTSLLLVKYAKLFVGHDSGFMHVASAFNIPTVVFFGPTVPEMGFRPFSQRYRIFEVKHLPCRPCSLHGEGRCFRGDLACMKWIREDMVLEYIRSFII